MKKSINKRVRDPNNFPKFEKFPEETCESFSEAVFVSYDFNDGLVGPWKGWSTDQVSAETFALRVSGRKRTWDGPILDMNLPGDCFSQSKEYLFSFRIKLDKSDGSGNGEPTSCASTG